MNESNDRGRWDDRSHEDGRGEPLRVVGSNDIFRTGERRVVIRHNDREYLLLVTRQGKLLLNRLS